MIRNLVVRMVSPALLGGAVSDECDQPSTLRLPSVRGQLRHWSQLLGGDELAHHLWGTTDSGQRVRLISSLRISKSPHLPDAVEAPLIPSKGIKAKMIPPAEESVLLRFAIPKDIDLPRLQAVAWTWLHLGAVGKRSRRGYGSLLWRPTHEGVLEGWPRLWPNHHLRDRSSLEEYLRLGLHQAWKELSMRPEDFSLTDREERLVSLEQVFVGKEIPGEWAAEQGIRNAGAESLEAALHGRDPDSRGGGLDKIQLGSGRPRLPSPMRWRVFPVAGETGYRPVLTWFPQGYPPDQQPVVTPESGLHRYLRDELGIETSLAGTSLEKRDGDED